MQFQLSFFFIVYQELMASTNGILGHHTGFTHLLTQKNIDFILSNIQKNHSWPEEIVGQIFLFMIGGEATNTMINGAINQDRLFSNGRIEMFALMPKYEYNVSR